MPPFYRYLTKFRDAEIKNPTHTRLGGLITKIACQEDRSDRLVDGEVRVVNGDGKEELVFLERPYKNFLKTFAKKGGWSLDDTDPNEGSFISEMWQPGAQLVIDIDMYYTGDLEEGKDCIWKTSVEFAATCFQVEGELSYVVCEVAPIIKGSTEDAKDVYKWGCHIYFPGLCVKDKQSVKWFYLVLGKHLHHTVYDDDRSYQVVKNEGKKNVDTWVTQHTVDGEVQMLKLDEIVDGGINALRMYCSKKPGSDGRRYHMTHHGKYDTDEDEFIPTVWEEGKDIYRIAEEPSTSKMEKSTIYKAREEILVELSLFYTGNPLTGELAEMNYPEMEDMYRHLYDEDGKEKFPVDFVKAKSSKVKGTPVPKDSEIWKACVKVVLELFSPQVSINNITNVEDLKNKTWRVSTNSTMCPNPSHGICRAGYHCHKNCQAYFTLRGGYVIFKTFHEPCKEHREVFDIGNPNTRRLLFDMPTYEYTGDGHMFELFNSHSGKRPLVATADLISRRYKKYRTVGNDLYRLKRNYSDVLDESKDLETVEGEEGQVEEEETNCSERCAESVQSVVEEEVSISSMEEVN